MGKIFKVERWTTALEAVMVAGIVIVVATVVWIFAPGILTDKSKTMKSLELSKEVLDNAMPTDKFAVPSITPSIAASKLPQVIIAGYRWNGETAIIGANGGPVTTKGSLMEANNVNLQIISQDWLSELRAMQMKFIEQYNSGQEFPTSDKAAMGIMVMGDGGPFYVSTMQSLLNKTFGKDKYHVQIVGCIGGMSDGEDKVIGPMKWKTNPKTMLGALISTVPGDGDWVTLINFCFANNLPVNPDFTTYDPNAVNIFPSKDDDYMNSARELIASQNAGFTTKLKVVKDGELTGKEIDKKIDGCATWTPGDKLVFDALSGFTDIVSTKDFPGQMATSLIVVKEWADAHPEIMTNILKSTLTAANQMKQYDDWHKHASTAVAKTFNLETPKYWYDMFKGKRGTKGGVGFSMGGTRFLNYADVMQYHGESDGNNRYKAVYDQVGAYLTGLNPFGFNQSVERLIPYEEAVNLTFLRNIKGLVQTTDAVTYDYSQQKTEVMAQGEWNINFATGSTDIQASSMKDIKIIYGILMQAEQTKVKVFGFTDNVGDPTMNLNLSDLRANSVVDALLNMGISVDRFQLVKGKGQADPIASNATAAGKAKNRRVEITLLQ